jgi:hypothetical protein
MKKKQFVIRLKPLPYGSQTPKYLKSLQSKRIISTRLIDNARGFASIEEAQALIEKISIQLPRLDLLVEDREAINGISIGDEVMVQHYHGEDSSKAIVIKFDAPAGKKVWARIKFLSDGHEEMYPFSRISKEVK